MLHLLTVAVVNPAQGLAPGAGKLTTILQWTAWASVRPVRGAVGAGVAGGGAAGGGQRAAAGTAAAGGPAQGVKSMATSEMGKAGGGCLIWR